MILKLLLFITTLIVRTESLWTKVTSKPSLPRNLQELLDSLYITGYMPEYILPENELTETEKTEGEYLDFPEFKNAEENVFVPPESEYLKNYAHFKNIKGHKRLVPHIVINSKTPKIWKNLRNPNPNIGPDELRLNLMAHLTENFTGRPLTQHDSAKLDFLIPIPEKGTYPPNPAPNLYIPLTESTMHYFPTPDSTGKIWEMGLVKPSFQNHTAYPPLPGGTMSDYQPLSYQIRQQPKPFTTDLYPAKPQVLGSPQQPLPVFLSQKLLFGCTAPQQPVSLFSIKQPSLHTMQYQPAVKIKPSHHNSGTQQLQSILMRHESQPIPLFFKTNRTISRPIQLSVHHPEMASERRASKVVNNRIKTKVVSFSVNSSTSGNPQMMSINPNYSAVQSNISLDHGTTANIDTKMISQTNSTINSYVVSVVEYTPPTKQKKKMFTFFNIFKKNKQNPIPEEHTHNASLKGKRENGAISLAELYNRLKDTNVMNENSRMEKQYPIKKEVEEYEIYHK